MPGVGVNACWCRIYGFSQSLQQYDSRFNMHCFHRSQRGTLAKTKIAGQNVEIVALPETGSSSAATAATQLQLHQIGSVSGKYLLQVTPWTLDQGMRL